MMSKERLEEIEKNLDPLGYGMGGHLISVKDIYWLVRYAKEQSERAQELEELVEGYKIELIIKNNAKKRARQRSKHYREALNNIITLWTSSTDATDDTWLAHKMSEVARKALEDKE